MHSRRFLQVLYGFVFGSSLLLITAQGETRRVAGNGDGYGTVTCAVLNNAGVVLFTGERVASSGERFRGIYKGNSGVTTLMEDSVDHPPAAGQLQLVSLDQAGISMNNGGVASWYGWRGAFSKLVVYKSAGSVARANFAFDTDKTVGLGQTTVTDDGYLAYDTIVRSLREGEFAWAQQFPVGSLNNKHQYLRDESGKWAIIELGFKLNDPHQLQPVQTNLTTLSSQQVFVMTINDSGTIAFWASQQNGSTFTGGIYRYSRGHTVPVVEVQLTNNISATEFTFENGFPAFAINNNDQVVFYGKSRTLGREGFFRGTNPLSDKIVAIGDVVDGEPLTFLRAPNNAGRRLDKWLNDRGEIVFVGAENNTTSGLYVTSGVQSPPSAASAVVRYNPPVSPPSSSFGVASNWQPLNGDAPRVPQKTTTLNDTALFDRPEVYTVDFNGNHEQVERVLVKNGNVLFLNGSINADALSFQEPSLTIDNARLDVGTAMGLTNNHAIIGSSAASRVDVGTGGRWRSFGSLQVGAGGEGILNIDPGGTVQSGEGRIGTGAAGGKAIVGKNGLWDSGNLAVGAGGKGEMTIQGGGKVDSSTASIGHEPSFGNLVRVEGNSDPSSGSGNPSDWETAMLVVGEVGAGKLEILDGGIVNSILSTIGLKPLAIGTLLVSGVNQNGQRSSFGSADLIVGEFGFGGVTIEDGGYVEAQNVTAGELGGIGSLTINGRNATSQDASELRVLGNLLIGDSQAGTMVIENGGQVFCTNGLISSTVAGMVSETKIVGSQSTWGIERTLKVGTERAESRGMGILTLVDGFMFADTLQIVNSGIVRGFGTIDVGNLVNNGGTISPGLSPGTITINGNYAQDFDGRLLIEIGGTNSADYDHLIITNAAVLDGNITFRFINGFAPKTGQRFDFLAVGGAIEGGFASVGLENLAPGFQFDVVTNGASLSMIALNDGVFSGALPGLVEITVTNLGGITYAMYAVTTSNTCNRITLDGGWVRTNNSFAQAFEGTVFDEGCGDEIVTVTNTIVLGALSPGNYDFSVTSAGQTLSTVPFTVPVGGSKTLMVPTFAADGSIQLQVAGLPPVQCTIEASVDLIAWIELGSGTLPFNFTDPDAAIFPARYYRARIGP